MKKSVSKRKRKRLKKRLKKLKWLASPNSSVKRKKVSDKPSSSDKEKKMLNDRDWLRLSAKKRRKLDLLLRLNRSV